MNDRSEMMAIADGSESANMHRPRTMAMSADSSYTSVARSLLPTKVMNMDQLAGASLTLAHLFRVAPSLLGSQIVREPIDERLRLWPLHREDPEV